MGISRARHRAFLLTLCSLSSLSLLATPIAGASNSDLVYKGCSNQTSAINGITSAISAVATSLTTQSASSKFYKTTSSNSGGGSAVFGLFQCRGDLNPSDCSACVSQALPMWAQLCGPTAAAARVQLTGCLALYQIQGFPQVSGTQLLFKTCGSGGGGGDFEVRRDTAFAQLESGIGGGVGFYATQYQSVYAMAQCEGDLSSGDCAECINQAVQKSEVECGGASSGQVYLDKCYISYNYYRNGFPHGGIGGGGSGGAGGQQTSKTVAIVLGSAVGLGFLVICLLFARNLVKKKDGKYSFIIARSISISHFILFNLFTISNGASLLLCGLTKCVRANSQPASVPLPVLVVGPIDTVKLAQYEGQMVSMFLMVQ